MARNELTLDVADRPEETPATDTGTARAATNQRDPLAALDDTPPAVAEGDSIRLLLQSPHRLFLYWTFATDPHAALRDAFGQLGAHYRLTVRLVKVESGEEFLLDATEGRAQWFEVYPRHAYRADVGFHAADRPFVRLLSSDVVRTPPDSASHVSDEAQEFQLEAGEFVRLLSGAGYERYAHGLEGEGGEGNGSHQTLRGDLATGAHQASHQASHQAADAYPHR